MSTITAAAPRRFPGRLFLWLGLGLVPLGVIGYAVQLALAHLWTPWYVPILTTCGVGCILYSLWQARSLWRVLALLLVLLLAGLEWGVLLAARLPPYDGPVAVEQTFPAFTTERADRTPFSNRDLQGQDSVLVFFRGRW
jgi:hypothetical protein